MAAISPFAIDETQLEIRLNSGCDLLVQQGDITKLAVDAIVNAANEAMLGGGGVDGAIHSQAGWQLLEACKAEPEVAPGVRCPTGQARITAAFELRCKYVIHTVGPVFVDTNTPQGNAVKGFFMVKTDVSLFLYI